MLIAVVMLFQFLYPKFGWTGVHLAAGYGFPDTVRELIRKHQCDQNAIDNVSHACLHVCYAFIISYCVVCCRMV